MPRQKRSNVANFWFRTLGSCPPKHGYSVLVQIVLTSLSKRSSTITLSRFAEVGVSANQAEMRPTTELTTRPFKDSDL